MRVVMFGYQTWGHRTLQALLDSSHDVVTVVTHPKSEHAYEKIWSDSVADLA
ncbi:methionyl-tRNA formyltransferase, partial [Streptomyces sp. SID5789]|nr:methionyl-tRNA formyltransferase [Streptomyces sp. SID5789]